RIEPEQLIPVISIDTEIELADIKTPFYNIICQMEPFGPENMRPVFICKNIVDTGNTRVLKEQHIKFSLKQGNVMISGIGFNLAYKMPLLLTKQPIDIVFTIEENEWNGEKSLQLKIIDFRLSATVE
ncbi:MAG: single-stranded-DNA-specific exonuclease RecJ, partial [Chitinophagaceae bacterium]|nr:single-stranded-DNA-specific exonuclease RecJ [Chitinophagaceae bacterium]